MFAATCPLFGVESPASTSLMIVNKAEPMQISRFVRRPESLCLHSRSTPMTPPIAHDASKRRVAVPESSICSSEEKWISLGNITTPEYSCCVFILHLANAHETAQVRLFHRSGVNTVDW